MVAWTLSQSASMFKLPSLLDIRMAKVKSLTAASFPGARTDQTRLKAWWTGGQEQQYLHLLPPAEDMVAVCLVGWHG